jgi:hypothetical protein
MGDALGEAQRDVLPTAGGFAVVARSGLYRFGDARRAI